jgi:hypothetical protein
MEMCNVYKSMKLHILGQTANSTENLDFSVSLYIAMDISADIAVVLLILIIVLTRSIDHKNRGQRKRSLVISIYSSGPSMKVLV